MNSNEIMKTAPALCGEEAAAPRLSAFGPSWANVLMAESFEAEQSIRRAKGLPELSEIPEAKSAAEPLPYSEELLRGAFVFGFASFIAEAGGDRELAFAFRSRYANVLSTAAKGFEHQIADCYGEG